MLRSRANPLFSSLHTFGQKLAVCSALAGKFQTKVLRGLVPTGLVPEITPRGPERSDGCEPDGVLATRSNT